MKKHLPLSVLSVAVLIITFIIAAGGPVFGEPPAPGESVTPQERLAQLFTSASLSADWFSPAVLAQLPLGQLQAIIDQYRGTLGIYQWAEGLTPPSAAAPGAVETTFQLIFDGGTVPAQIVLDNEGRIAGLWLGVPQLKVAGLEELISRFTELPGQVSLLVYAVDSQEVLAAVAPTTPLAVGSTFKLAVLAALKDKIAAGALAWNQVVRLEEKHKSLPTGILQTWPAGSALTIESLAALMISLSDNTATDLLIDVVGPEVVELYAGNNRPFLSTRQAFILKSPENSAFLEEYRRGDTQKRREVLQAIEERQLPDPSLFGGNPVALDVEWFFSVNDLVNLMAYVQELPLMSINPGAADAANWQRVAYKGGSEPGVISMTTWLVSKSGKSYAVSATWNDDAAPLDEAKFIGLYGSLLEELRKLDEQKAQ